MNYVVLPQQLHSAEWMQHTDNSVRTPLKKRGGGISFGSWAVIVVGNRLLAASSRSHVFRKLNMPLFCYCLTGLPDLYKNCLICELFYFLNEFEVGFTHCQIKLWGNRIKIVWLYLFFLTLHLIVVKVSLVSSCYFGYFRDFIFIFISYYVH